MQVVLRRLAEEDLPLLLAWSRIPEIWKFLPTSRRKEKLTWEKHHAWFHNRKARSDFIIDIGRPVGVIHVDYEQDFYPEIGLYIGEPDLWGQGIGKKALQQILERCPDPVAYAVIHPKNKRSIRLFTSLGFHRVGKARNGQHLYQIKFGASLGCTAH
jgi:RimJ/RimL family protein N-acetyltransferase